MAGAQVAPQVMEVARAREGGPFDEQLASEPRFQVGKPEGVKTSNPNTDQVALAAFMEGINTSELETDEAISGASPIMLGGRRVATLFFRSTERSRYHLFAQLVLADANAEHRRADPQR